MKSNIKKLMEEKKMTVRRMQERANLSHLTIFRARDDKTIEQCTLITLRKIAQALECKVKDLFEEGEDENNG